METKKFVVRDREAGNIISYVDSKEEGLKLIQEYEQEDKFDGIYEPDFYELAEIEIANMECSLLEKLNPREFSKYLKENYKHFNVYQGLKYIGTAKYIFGYYAYVEELGEKKRVISIADTSDGGAIIYVED